MTLVWVVFLIGRGPTLGSCVALGVSLAVTGFAITLNQDRNRK